MRQQRTEKAIEEFNLVGVHWGKGDPVKVIACLVNRACVQLYGGVSELTIESSKDCKERTRS